MAQLAGRARWPGLCMITGGAIMLALWPVFTILHGPTSVNEGGELLGKGPLFWGAMMEGPSLLLLAAGMFGCRRLLTEDGRRAARVGFVMALSGLAIPGVANLAVLGVWPPLLAPVLGAGLVLVATGQGDGSRMTSAVRTLLIGLAGTQFFAFLWFLLVRPDVLDRIDGYRIYGLVANVLFAIGWILLGTRLSRARLT